MLEAEIQLIKEQIGELRPEFSSLSDRFFYYLFDLDPSLEQVFADDPTARRTKFTNMMATLANLKDLQKIATAIRGLGKRHVGYGVKERYYGLGRKALLLMLEEHYGAPFAGKPHDAWAAVLDAIIAMMIEGALDARSKQGADAQFLSEAENTGTAGLSDPQLLAEIGGFEGMYQVHLVFYNKLFNDDWLGRFFWGKKETALAKKQTHFMVACLGGENQFVGETPAISHMHMYITEEMLDLREQILRDTIAEFGISKELEDRWLRVDNAFRLAVIKHSVDECVLRCVGQRAIQAKKPAEYPWPPAGD